MRVVRTIIPGAERLAADVVAVIVEHRLAALARALLRLRRGLAPALLFLAWLAEQPDQHENDDADEKHRDAYCGIPGEADGGIHASIPCLVLKPRRRAWTLRRGRPEPGGIHPARAW